MEILPEEIKYNLTVLYYKIIYIERITIIFLLAGAIGTFISGFLRSVGMFISSIIVFFVGIFINYKKHPRYAIFSIILFVVMLTITAAYFFSNFANAPAQILTLGIYVILVIVTTWYASIMQHQVSIMNNEKLGKVIAEISRSIFSPMKNGLNEIQTELKDGTYVSELHPSKLKFKDEWEKILDNYLSSDVVIIPVLSDHKRMNTIWRSAKQLLDIDDDELNLTLLLLGKLKRDFYNNIEELSKAHQQFDDDFIPYWIPFKEECTKLDPSNSFDKQYDPDFAKVLKYVFIQCDFLDSEERIYIGHNKKLPQFIDENREKLYSWMQNISVLKIDIENIEKKKLGLIENISEIVKEIRTLLSIWKITYYLTEEELEAT
jgi:hypothetical protein